MQFAQDHTVELDQNSDLESETLNPILMNTIILYLYLPKLVAFKSGCLLTSPGKYFAHSSASLLESLS